MDTTEMTDTTQSTLEAQLIREAEAMAKYAYSTGLKVPEGVAEALEPWLERCRHKGNDAQGILESPGIKELAGIHDHLAQVVSPATPRTILLLANEEAQSGFWLKFGPLPIVRQMMLVSCFFTAIFIGLSLSGMVNEDSITKTPLSGSGPELLMTTLFLLAAAGLGASFAALFKVNQFIVEGTFDPKYESSYWIKLVLGLSAGLMLAELIPFEKSGSMPVLAKPTLAMLGGYSVDVVYRILNRLTQALSSFVRGEPKELIAQSIKANRAQLEEKLSRHRLETANALMKLHQQVSTGLKPQEVQQNLERLVEDMMPSETGRRFNPVLNGKEAAGQQESLPAKPAAM